MLLIKKNISWYMLDAKLMYDIFYIYKLIQWWRINYSCTSAWWLCSSEGILPTFQPKERMTCFTILFEFIFLFTCHTNSVFTQFLHMGFLHVTLEGFERIWLLFLFFSSFNYYYYYYYYLFILKKRTKVLCNISIFGLVALCAWKFSSLLWCSFIFLFSCDICDNFSINRIVLYLQDSCSICTCVHRYVHVHSWLDICHYGFPEKQCFIEAIYAQTLVLFFF
jgi:hypothetical protein